MVAPIPAPGGFEIPGTAALVHEKSGVGTVLLVMAGWASLLYRIRAEERMLSRDPGWPAYAARVRYRLLPGLW